MTTRRETSPNAGPATDHDALESEPYSTHVYSTQVLLMDSLRGLVGLLVCCVLIVIIGIEHWLATVLMGFAALFCLYLYRVVRRGRSCFEMDSSSLRAYATRRSARPAARLNWDELQRFELDYFCTRRDGRGGWLQLRLRAHATPMLRLDSRLSGFERILANALHAARSCNVVLSAATASNLHSFGFDDGFDDDDSGNDGAVRSMTSATKSTGADVPGSQANAQ